jgi:hypothetical protein
MQQESMGKKTGERIDVSESDAKQLIASNIAGEATPRSASATGSSASPRP